MLLKKKLFLQRILSGVDESAEIFYLVTDDGKDAASLNWGELDRHAKGIAHDLTLHHKIQAGERVLLVYPPSLEFVETLLGCLYAGIIAVPIAPPDPMHMDLTLVNNVIADCHPSAILTTKKYNWAIKAGKLKRFVQLKHQKIPDIPWLVPNKSTNGHFDPMVADAGDIALLQYTSGSTSAPKGVCISWKNLLHQVQLNQEMLGFTAQSRLVMWIPHFHDFGLISGILNIIYGNGQLWMISPMDFIKKPALWMEVMHRVKATHTAAPNFAYGLVARKTSPAQRQQWDLSHLQVYMSAAEPIQAVTCDAFMKAFESAGLGTDAFSPAYGLAEHTVGVTMNGSQRISIDKQKLLKNRVELIEMDAPLAKPLISCGKNHESIDIAIVDPDSQRRCQSQEVGEIWVDSASKALGYWGRPELSTQIFQAKIQGEKNNNDRLYLRTGDLGFIHHGELFITGRLKDVIIINGENIYPQDLELVVEKSHVNIRPGCVIAFSYDAPEGNEAVGIALEVNDVKMLQHYRQSLLDALLAAVWEQHSAPLSVIVILSKKQLPKTTSGKVQRQACKRLFNEGELQRKCLFIWQSPNFDDNKHLDVSMNEIEQGSLNSENTYDEKANKTPRLNEQVPITTMATENDIQIWLQSRLKNKLNCHSSEVDLNASFASYGLTSVILIELANDLEKLLDISISPILFYDYPSISTLSSHLAEMRLNKTDVDKNTQESQCKISAHNVNHDTRIVIVGAGVAGLMSAYTLAQRGYRNIVIYEKEQQVGGKVQSVTINNEICELGQLVIFSDYNIKELISQLGLKTALSSGYLLDPLGSTVSMDYLSTVFRCVGIAQDEEINSSYLTSHPDLFEPLLSWLSRHDLLPLPDSIAYLWNGCGYGHLDEEVPLYYFLLAFKSLYHLRAIKVAKGNQELWTQLASKLIQDYGVKIRLGRAIDRITRTAFNVYLHAANQQSECYDKLIMACPIEACQKILDCNEPTQQLFSTFQSYHYISTVFECHNLSDDIAVFSQHHKKQYVGHMVQYVQAFTDKPYYLAYQFNSIMGGEPQFSERELSELLIADLQAIGATDIVIHCQKYWNNYFPVLNSEKIKTGVLTELNDLQGKHNTYFVGSYLSFELVSHTAYFSERLIKTFFPVVSKGKSEQLTREPIAVIGMACRFPKADNIDAFWTLLLNGEDAISPVPETRWSVEQYYDEQLALGKTNSRWGGFIEDVDLFDAAFFSISPREAKRLDPQQRLLLETSYTALENTGYSLEQLSGSQTGVYIGISTNDYGQLYADYHDTSDAYTATGTEHSLSANRLSYFYGLHGPSIAVSTACSSSLTALHYAIQDLRTGASEQALVGGVNVILAPDWTISIAQAQMLSSDGRCKTFDAAADGYVRSEGCGVVFLKPLSKAQAEGDRIIAVIEGSAVNQDGPSNGLTAPNGLAQQQVITAALANAQCHASDISYVETHGTGTSLGDPIEVTALSQIYRPLGKPQDFEHNKVTPRLILGASKSNVGHLEAAAGIAGLIKTALCLQHKQIPPHRYIDNPNPYIDWDSIDIELPTGLIDWQVANNEPSRQRMAGVSSFGFGGTNVHAILREAPQKVEKERSALTVDARALQCILLSGHSAAALNAQVVQLVEHLEKNPEQSLRDIAYSLATTRSHFKQRLVLLANDKTALVEALNKRQKGKVTAAMTEFDPDNPVVGKTAFMFTGQGAQLAGMGEGLYGVEPIFTQTLDQCAQLLKEHLPVPLLKVLFSDAGSEAALLAQTQYTQPALFALGYALAQQWQAWGVKPDVLLGHSVGEITAACVAGVFSLEDAVCLIAARGRLMQALPAGGGMVSMQASVARLTPYINDYAKTVAIAAINGPEQTVISGVANDLKRICAELEKEGIKYIQLAVSHAFHSPLMDAMLADFSQVAETITYQVPTQTLISSVTGLVAEETVASADYWVAHVRATVQFQAGIENVMAAGVNTLIEMGPQPVLLGMAQQCLTADVDVLSLPSLRKHQTDMSVMLSSLAEYHVQGGAVNWAGFYQGREGVRVPLPTYPFQRQRYWLDKEATKSCAGESEETEHSLWTLLQQGDDEGIAELLRSDEGQGLSELAQQTLPEVVAKLSAFQDSQQQQQKLASFCYQLEWESLTNIEDLTVPVYEAHYLLLLDNSEVSASIKQTMMAEKANVQCLYLDEWLAVIDDATQQQQVLQDLLSKRVSNHWQGVVCTWGLHLSSYDSNGILTEVAIEAQQPLWLIVSFLQQLLYLLRDQGLQKTPCWLLSQGAVAVNEKESVINPEQGSLWGLGKTLALEHPTLWGGLIDLPLAFGTEDAAALCSLLSQPLKLENQAVEDLLALRSQRVFGQRLVSSQWPKQETRLPIRDTVLITGGLGALGLQVARWVAQQGASQVVLVSRRDPHTEAVMTALAPLREMDCQVRLVQADVCDEAVMTEVIATYNSDAEPLRLVVHAAGLAETKATNISLYQADEFSTILAPKIRGTQVLEKVLKECELDSFMVFSSMFSVLGSDGRAAYSAANAYLDAWGQSDHAYSVQVINWGPWRGGGMANAQIQQQLQARGIHSLPLPLCLNVLERILTPDTGMPPIIVTDMDWPLFRSVYDSQGVRTLLAGLPVANTLGTSTAEQSPLFEQLQKMTLIARQEKLTHWLQSRVAEVLGGTTKVDTQCGLFELGMDSLMAVTLSKTLQRDLGVSIMPSTVVSAVHIEALSEQLLIQMDLGDDNVQLAPSAPESDTDVNEPIAIVGVGCHLPGDVHDLESLWKLLDLEEDCVSAVPAERWNWENYYDPSPDSEGKSYSYQGYFIDGIDLFDAHFYGMSPSEATKVDPQHRLLLEASWQALEQAGVVPAQLSCSQTGIYVGIGPSEYEDLHSGNLNQLDAYDVTGTHSSFSAGRLSYLLGLQGPSLAVDTACSSSLVALHLAVQALRLGECDLALAGGVQALLSPLSYVALSRIRAISADGRCKGFSEQADGYGRGEGCAMVALRRLSDAKARGETVYGLIRGSAVNHDGRSSGLTVPNGEAQQKVIYQALANAQLAPAEIDYVEAHGTGTALGDPIEIDALQQVYGQARSDLQPLYVGSIKSNIGHLESAAGIAGLLKVLTAFQHQAIPRHLHADSLNQSVEWEKLAINISTEATAWKRTAQRPRRAGLSGFGLSGTNAHVILEEAPVNTTGEQVNSIATRGLELLPLSAKTTAALNSQIKQLAEHLSTNPEQSLRDITYSLATTRSHFKERLVLLVNDKTALAEALKKRLQGKVTATVTECDFDKPVVGKIAFMFTGQGAQLAGMGKGLYGLEPIFTQALDQCAQLLKEHLNVPLLKVLFSDADSDVALLAQTQYTQPALFALGFALAQQWQAWGVKPNALLGHSVGEITAACVAGVFSLEDAVCLIAARGRLMQALPTGGGMVSVQADVARLRPYINDYAKTVAIAAINGPEQTVISGVASDLKRICAALTKAGVKYTQLTVSHAFHSPLMEAMLVDFRQVAKTITYQAPTKTLISNVTGLAADETVASADYWVAHVREAVQFQTGVETVMAAGVNTLIEMGPQPVLLGMAQQCLKADKEVLSFPSLRKHQDDMNVMLSSLAAYHVQGGAVNWAGFYQGREGVRVPLPTYPFQRQRYWLDKDNVKKIKPLAIPFLGECHKLATGETAYIQTANWAQYPWLVDHRVYNRAVLPNTSFISMVFQSNNESEYVVMSDVLFQEPLFLPHADTSREIQLFFSASECQTRHYQILSREADSDHDWVLHAKGVIEPLAQVFSFKKINIKTFKQNLQVQEATSLEAFWARSNIEYGPKLQAIMAIWSGDGGTLGEIGIPEVLLPDLSGEKMHPVLLDAATRLVANMIEEQRAENTESVFWAPWKVDKVTLQQVTTEHCYALITKPGRFDLDAQTYRYDIEIYDASGCQIGEVLGFTLKKASQTAMLSRLQKEADSLLYEEKWQRMEMNASLMQEKVAVAQCDLCWLIVSDSDSRSQHLSNLIDEKLNRDSIVVTAGEQFKTNCKHNFTLDITDRDQWNELFNVLNKEALSGVIWNVHDSCLSEDILTQAKYYCGSLLAFCQSIEYHHLPSLSQGITLLTHRAMAIKMGDSVNPMQRMLWGQARAFNAELLNLPFQMIDYDGQSASLAEISEAVCNHKLVQGTESAFYDGHWWDLRISPVKRHNNTKVASASTAVDTLIIKPHGTYLITGGLGGLGLEAASWLASQGAEHIVLCGRSVPDDSINVTLTQLRETGVIIDVFQTDIADKIQVKQLISSIEANSNLPLKGIIHAAGVVETMSIDALTWRQFEAILKPKVLGTYYLHEASLHLTLDFFICYSSIYSLFGSVHLSSYSAANAYLDGFAQYRQSQNLPALTVQWGPWAGVGMLQQDPNNTVRLLKLGLFTPVVAGTAHKALLSLLQQGTQLAAVIDADWEKVSHVFGGRESTLFSELQVSSTPHLAQDIALLEQVKEASTEEAYSLIESYVLVQVAGLLLIDESSMSADTPLMSLGMDSLMAFELQGSIQKQFNCKVPVNLLLDNTSVASLAEYINEHYKVSSRDKSDKKEADNTIEYQKKTPVQGWYPLSSGQEALWYEYLLAPQSSVYTLSASMYIRAKIDVSMMRKTFQILLERHPALRITIQQNAESRMQYVHSHLEVDFKHIEVADWEMERIHRAITDVHQLPFDLEAGPLFRACLLSKLKNEHYLILSMHHIISDGHSMWLIIDEFPQIYTALTQGGNLLPDPDSHFIDYLRWQEDVLLRDEQSLRNFWQRELSGELPILDFPIDNSRPSLRAFEGGAHRFRLSSQLTSKLRGFAREQGVSLYMLLLASYQVLLARYTGQKDILINTPMAGRTEPKFKRVVGYMVSSVVIRAHLSDNITFVELLKQVRDKTIAVLSHQHFPFTLILDSLNLQRDLSRPTLAQAAFSLQQDPYRNTRTTVINQKTGFKQIQSSDLCITPLSLSLGEGMFELELELFELIDCFEGFLKYDKHLFKASSIQSVAESFEFLLDNIIKEPEALIRDISLISEWEKHQQLVVFNNTEAPYPKDKTLQQLFEEQVERTPNNIALVFEGEELTYLELNQKANQLAYRIRKHYENRYHDPLKPDTLIALYLDRSLEMVISMLAVLKAGGAYVPLALEYPKARTVFMLQDTNAPFVITQRHYQALLNDWLNDAELSSHVIELDDISLCSQSSHNPAYINQTTDLAYVIYTSGTTGQPKGVMNTHGNLLNLLQSMQAKVDFTQGTWLAATSVSFDISILELLCPLTQGCRVVIAPDENQMSQVQHRHNDKTMAFSLFYFASDEGNSEQDKYRLLLEGAKFADLHDFKAVWTPERHFGEFGGLYPNPAVTASALAAITDNIDIRAGSCVLPLHHPVRVAEDWSVIDNISGGRVGIAFATGWQPDDFILAPEKFKDRSMILIEDVNIVQSLWRGEGGEFVDPNGKLIPIQIKPKPLQDELPSWLTIAGNPNAFRVAGQQGLKVLTHLLGQTVEELAEKIAIYHTAWAEAGHAGEGHVSLMLHTFIADDKTFVLKEVEQPFKAYLRQSIALLVKPAAAMGFDIHELSDEAMEQVLDAAFKRYYQSSALFGSAEDCLPLIDSLKGIGVNEVACLIDFGVDHDTVLSNLPFLDDLRYRSQPENAQPILQRRAIGELLTTYGVTHFQCTPSRLTLLLEDETAHDGIAQLTHLLVGGENFSALLLERYQAFSQHSSHSIRLINMYGPTETTIWSTAFELTHAQHVSIGRPIGNTQVYVLDEQLKLVPIGTSGQLFIGGAGVARGYFNREALTQAHFIINPFATQEDIEKGYTRLYKTGDLVRWLPNGNLEYLGRLDRQVKIRGFRIELGEIESALCQLEGIKQAVVIDKESDKGSENDKAKYLAAYYVPVQGTDNRDTALDDAMLRAALSQSLPDHMVPMSFTQIDRIPLTLNGKLDRQALPEPDLIDKYAYVAPRNELESQLCEIWQQVLFPEKQGLERVGIHDNFFRIGGDSIVSIQLVSRLRRAGYQLQVKDIFNWPTIALLSVQLAAESEASVIEHSVIESEQGVLTGAFDLLPIQQWFFHQALLVPHHYNQAFSFVLPADIDKNSINQALEMLSQQHDMLRVCFNKVSLKEKGCMRDGQNGYRQCYTEQSTMLPLLCVDTALLSAQQLQAKLTACQASLSIDENLLWQVVHLTGYEDGRARLCFMLHHLLIDAVSWRIIVNDMHQLLTGQALLNKTSSYRQWVDAVKEYAHRHQGQREYWQKQLDSIMPFYQSTLLQSSFLPQSAHQSSSTPFGSASSSGHHNNSYKVAWSATLTEQLLRDAPAGFYTDINALLLSALAMGIHVLCDEKYIGITLEGHGRENIDESIDKSLDTTSTVGWFTTVFPVVLPVADTLAGTIIAVKESLKGIPNKGIGFGALGFDHDALPPICFNYLGQFDNHTTRPQALWQLVHEETGESISALNQSPYVLNLNGGIIDGQLQFSVGSRLTEKETQVFVEAFEQGLKDVVACALSEAKKGGVHTPSDYPVSDLSMERLTHLQSRYDIEAIFNANSLQQGFIYHVLSQAQDDAYRVQLLLDYHDGLDLESYQQAWQLASMRYPALRMAFDWNGEPLQIITQGASINASHFTVMDLSHLSEAERDEEIIAIQQQDRQQEFDLTQPGLLRFTLFKHHDNHYTVMKTDHLSVSDGWSGPVLWQYVHETYQSLVSGETPHVEAEQAYIEAQTWLAKQSSTTQTYWQTQRQHWLCSNDINSLLSSKVDLTQRKAITSPATQKLCVAGEKLIQLKAMCCEQAVTLNVAVQFAWHKLLQVYTGDEQTLVGTTVSGRDIPVDGVEASVGLYINTLPLTVNWSDNSTCAEILQSIQQSMVGLSSHSGVSLASLQTQSERLFHSLLVFENYLTPVNDNDFLPITIRDSIEKTDYPLTLMAYEGAAGLEIVLSYDGDNVDDVQVARLLNQFNLILRQVSQKPERPQQALSLLSDEERHTLLREWNSTDVPYSREKTLQQLFEEQVEQTPNNIALVFEDEELTYLELNQKANQLAYHLRSQYQKQYGSSLKADTLIALYLDHSLEMVISILAVLKAGGAYVPIEPECPKARIVFMLKDINAPFVIIQSHYHDQLSGWVSDEWLNEDILACNLIRADDERLASQATDNLTFMSQATDLAYVIYTSGTTGQPKGVMIEHRAIVNYFYALVDKLPHGLERVDFSTNYSFDLSVTTMLCPLFTGGAVCVYSEDTFNVEAYQQHLIRHQINSVKLTPSLAALLLDGSDYKIKQVILGGEKLTPYHISQLQEYAECIINEFGPTEATVGALFAEQDKDNEIGKAYANVSFYVLNNRLNLAPIGISGELYIGGAGLARGYLNQPELTAERFIDNPFAIDEDIKKGDTRLYKTGDVVRYLPDGNLEYLGRNDNQVKIRGFRIELGEIESTLCQLEGIKQAVVIDKESDKESAKESENDKGKYLAAYYVPVQGADNIKIALDDDTLRAQLLKVLPDYMVPLSFTPIDAVPLTLNGKLDREALPETEFIKTNEYVAPRNELESQLCNIWQQVLGLERVGIHDNFFRIGGDSVSAIRLSAQARLLANIDIPLASLLIHPTIAQLAIELNTINHEKVIIHSQLAQSQQPENIIEI
ncbi:non-ribosomal peptide synthetase/type I polyketide synthase [uncultured Shewanella sp.]|uniref:non-ribosomal peptide synthetase/type I polyketide synthase n=1 Tax=uncultured Shewanella sp. TaxID=173975 RepID=UPI00260D5278|nr:non-ribosomal peptide synthetase/type I polyketide synthase [uncultured Shewanella sp.]